MRANRGEVFEMASKIYSVDPNVISKVKAQSEADVELIRLAESQAQSQAERQAKLLAEAQEKAEAEAQRVKYIEDETAKEDARIRERQDAIRREFEKAEQAAQDKKIRDIYCSQLIKSYDEITAKLSRETR